MDNKVAKSKEDNEMIEAPIVSSWQNPIPFSPNDTLKSVMVFPTMPINGKLEFEYQGFKLYQIGHVDFDKKEKKVLPWITKFTFYKGGKEKKFTVSKICEPYFNQRGTIVKNGMQQDISLHEVISQIFS